MFYTEKEYPEGIISVASNGRIGRYVFFPKMIEAHFNYKLPKKLVMVDVACGAAADHPLLYDFFDKKNVELTLIGVDINEETIRHTLEGKIAYGLECDNILENNKLSFDRDLSSEQKFKDMYSYDDIEEYFDVYKKKIFDGVVNIALNKKDKAWIMNTKSRERLDLRIQDATKLDFETNYADIVVCENFLFGRKDELGNKIRFEMDRILKPGGWSYYG
ncbi:MAG: methyltransferase domain-containing protein [Candidatus Woesearchaeota archaeon]